MKKNVVIRKGVSNEDLARMVAKGFGGMETRMGGLETRMGGLETRMGGLETRMGGLETEMGGLGNKIDEVEKNLSRKIDNIDRRIDDVVTNYAKREEVKTLSMRVDRLEEKIGLKSK